MPAQPSRPRLFFSLSLPIVLVLLAQVLMSMISIAVVSPLGPAAVAGIGIASAQLFVLMALLYGIDAGVQVLVARRLGAGQAAEAGAVLSDGLALAAMAGPMLTLVGYLAGPFFLRLATKDTTTIAYGLAFLNAALPILLFVGASFTCSAWRNGAGTPRYSFLAILLQVPCHALLSWALVLGAAGLPRLEMAGAGLATTLAALITLGFHVLLAWRIAPVPGFLSTRPSWSGIGQIVGIGLPVSLQQSLFNVGGMVLLGIVGLNGTVEVAAMSVVLTTMLLPILAATGMGIAAATLVGGAVGRGDVDDARRWGWQSARLGALVLLPISLIILAAPRATLGLFVADRTTIEQAAAPLAVLALPLCIDAFGRILGFALRGAGATGPVTSVALALQWPVYLPLCWLIGVHLGFGLMGIALTRLVTFVIEAAIVTLMWRSGFWSRGASRAP